MLPYAVGAWIYHARDTCRHWLSNNSVFLLPWLIPLYVLLMMSNSIPTLRDMQTTWIFYFGLGMSALIVATLGNLYGRFVVGGTDQAIGNLSYPIYVFHYAAGAVMAALSGLPAKSMGTFLLTLPFLLAIAWSVARLNEVTIEAWRQRVSGRAQRLLAVAA